MDLNNIMIKVIKKQFFFTLQHFFILHINLEFGCESLFLLGKALII